MDDFFAVDMISAFILESCCTTSPSWHLFKNIFTGQLCPVETAKCQQVHPYNAHLLRSFDFSGMADVCDGFL